MRSPTARWLLRRLGLAVFVVFGAATAAFSALHLTPGDPARAVIGLTVPSPEVLDQVRHDLGLDRPIAVQYGSFLTGLVRGDLGRSYQLQQPVSRLIAEQLPATVELAFTAFTLALLAALALATATAGRRPALRRISSTVELVLASSPAFWVGVLLLTVFSFRLNLLPAAGGTGVRGQVLPALTLALSMVGVFTQVLREGMERALVEPFVLTSLARGTGQTMVRFRHVLRHALVPLVTLSGWTVGTLLGGAVVVETVFSRPGIGRIMATAIERRDFPVVTGVVVVSAVLFTVINLVVDWLYRVVDPRVEEFG